MIVSANGMDFLGNDPLKTADALERLALDMRMLAAGHLPDRKYISEAPLLHCWSAVQRPRFALSGTVYGHPAISDGRTAITSELFAINRQRQWARTMSRFYGLGPASMEGLQ